ncbi:TrkA family potassium uptake protein [Haloferax sp. MBLA0076]|uniref:TrkA family potassium uptake protein n=1 Tax=Haloferax litoreum TaxID=2666140 RepID=A0A6A8GJR3_9EURY|nr:MULTISPECIES: NAD-binding protein [Haloferax]KAB1193780.1 TrkA family potassium uptake protein [Haloferax sp. CBA1148]MRX22317.1 TrkA family potassium uptake protein [Haloferax litoreum]
MVSLPESIRRLKPSRRARHIIYYVIGLVLLVLLYTLVYNFALARLEGVDQSLFASFEFVIQTMTTTGYGQDSDIWSHPLMFLFVVTTQISGIAIGFFTLRLIIIPLFTGAEVNLDDRLSPKSGHVIICEYRRDSAVLLDELREFGIEYVLISSSREDAEALSNRGYAAIHGSPQDAETFERASIDTARAVITDAGDANVNTILTVRSLRSDVDVIALTDDSDMQEILHKVGADTVLSPHGVLGHRLAEKAVASFSSELRDTIEIGGDTRLMELPVSDSSELVGRRIRDTNVRERTGATIVGAWFDGELQLPPSPDAIVAPNTVLLVSGEEEALKELSEFIRPPRSFTEHERFVLVGLGEVGQSARRVIEESGAEVVTIDLEDRAGVDIVGDGGSREVLLEAGVENAGAIIVGVPDDSTALLTSVLAQSLNPDIEVLVRVSDADTTQKAFSAGADYVLSVPRVSARMVAKELRGEDVLAPASQIRLVRVLATPFAGSTLADSGIYEQTGCRVIAIEDGEGQTSAVDPQWRFTGSERITIVGSDETVQNFIRRFDVSPTELPS